MANQIRGIFKKKNSKTFHYSPTQGENAEKLYYPRQIVSGSGQSVGLQRDHNEDALFCFTSVLADGVGNDYLGLFIIADGMGGHRNGEIASSYTCRVVSQYLLQKLYSPSMLELKDIGDEDFHDMLDQAIAAAQKAVLKNAPGGGTTVTVALWRAGKVTTAQVGDSRAYFILPDGKLQKITKDHSLVQRLIDLNEITEKEAEVHPQKNVLLRAIGQPDPFKADTCTIPVPPGAKIMLCSDGLWGVVDEDTLVKIVMSSKDPIIACDRLLDAANENGGPDNISVIIADLKG